CTTSRSSSSTSRMTPSIRSASRGSARSALSASLRQLRTRFTTRLESACATYRLRSISYDCSRQEGPMVRDHQSGEAVFRSILPEDIKWKPFKMKNPNALGQRAMAVTTAGKNRIMIYGPKPDGTYVVEQATVLEAWRAPWRGPRLFFGKGCQPGFFGLGFFSPQP